MIHVNSNPSVLIIMEQLFQNWLIPVSEMVTGLSFIIISFFIYNLFRNKRGLPLPNVFRTFALFFLLVGLSGVISIAIPDISGTFLKALTAIFSVITAGTLYKNYTAVMALRTEVDYRQELSNTKKSETKFMGVLESAPDAIVISNKEGKILIVNAQTEKLFGYKRNELIGKNIEILVPERFHPIHVRHREGYVADPKVRGMGIGMELFGKHKDGHEFSVEISLSPVEFEEEGLTVVAAIRDITQQKKSEAEIRKLNEELDKRVMERTAELEISLQSERKAREESFENQLRLRILTEAGELLTSTLEYHKTVETLTRLVIPKIADWCTIDEIREDGSIIRLAASHIHSEKTPLLYEMAGKYPSDPKNEKSLYHVFYSHKPLYLKEISENFLDGATQSPDQKKNLQELGINSIMVVPLMLREKVYGTFMLVWGESGKMYSEKDLEFTKELARKASLAIENARLYEELQKSNIELEKRVAHRTYELEALNKELESFSYSVSHDLRAPLRSIDGFSNKILKDFGSMFNDQGKDYFMRIMKASQTMGHLIDDLLKLARLSRMEMTLTETNISILAESIAEDLKSQEPERKALFTIQPGMLVIADRQLIQIALQNLLGNAWKYTRKKPETLIEFGNFSKNGQTIYFVKDNGVGFDMNYVDKLFGAFQRLHSATEFEGTGIGLATVLRVIRRHKGNIWAEGELNKGATFFFTL